MNKGRISALSLSGLVKMKERHRSVLIHPLYVKRPILHIIHMSRIRGAITLAHRNWDRQ